MHSRAGKHLDAFSAVSFQLQGGRTVAAKPVMFDVAGALALGPENISWDIKDEDAAVAKIDERFIALRVSAIVDHGSFSHCERRQAWSFRR
jgi:hypothetical protein